MMRGPLDRTNTFLIIRRTGPAIHGRAVVLACARCSVLYGFKSKAPSTLRRWGKGRADCIAVGISRVATLGRKAYRRPWQSSEGGRL